MGIHTSYRCEFPNYWTKLAILLFTNEFVIDNIIHDRRRQLNLVLDDILSSFIMFLIIS